MSMSRRFANRFALVCVCVMMLVALSSGGVLAHSGGVLAQTATETEPTESTESVSEQGQEQDVVRLDRFTQIVDYQYDRERQQWIVVFAAEEPGQVTLISAGQFKQGATTGSIRQERLPRGETTVSLKGQEINGQSTVVVTSIRSLESGVFIGLSSGQNQPNPFAETPGTVGWAGGASVTILMGLLAFRRRLRGGSGSPDDIFGNGGEQ